LFNSNKEETNPRWLIGKRPVLRIVWWRPFWQLTRKISRYSHIQNPFPFTRAKKSRKTKKMTGKDNNNNPKIYVI
jgi:hypothetical protein